MALIGAVDRQQALVAIDFSTLALLLGMMIVVANLKLSGAFALAARAVLAGARSGFGLLALTTAGAGLLAAFFINDVVCLALAPILIDAARMLGVPAEPFDSSHPAGNELRTCSVRRTASSTIRSRSSCSSA